MNNDGNSITNDALQTNVHSRKDTLIESLKEEINFLRNQVKSQNRIIELMTVKSNNAVDTRNMNTSKKPMKKDEINNQIEILLNTGDVGSEQIRNEDNDRKEYGHDVNSNITETNVIETNEKGLNKRSIAILSDSMLKDVEAFKMREALGRNEKIYIKTFPGATVQDMEHYIKPSLKFKNDLLIIHTGTNSLRSTKGAEDIANEIMNLAKSIKNETNEIMISGIIPRRDRLNTKGSKVNDFLQTLCTINNIHFIKHSNISSTHHLNAGGLHLNIKGTYKVAENLLNAITL